MARGISTLVVTAERQYVDSVESALATVYDDVQVVTPADGETRADCVIAVTPLGDAGWKHVETTTDGTEPPVIALAGGTDGQVHSPQTDAVVDIVDATGQWEQTLANRVRGVVQFRRHEANQSRPALGGTHLRRLQEIATETDLPFEEKAERLLEVGLDRLGVENAHLSTVDREPEHYEVIASVGELPISAGDLMDLPTTFCRRTIETDDVVSISHAREDGWAGDPAYETGDVECYLGARILVGGSLYGTVCFLDRSPHSTFTEAEQTFVSLVARWLSHELERTRREAALETLHAGTTELMRATTKRGVCEVAVGIAGDLVESPLAHVWVLDDDETLRPRASLHVGESPAAVTRRDERGSRLWTALDTGSVAEYGGEASAVSGLVSDTRVRSEMVVPLDEQGVLTIASELAAAFDAIEKSLLKMLGSVTVAALERTDRIE
ncbi:MAG: GAF domain-containing protein, partial [Halorientalis sp.]